MFTPDYRHLLIDIPAECKAYNNVFRIRFSEFISLLCLERFDTFELKHGLDCRKSSADLEFTLAHNTIVDDEGRKGFYCCEKKIKSGKFLSWLLEVPEVDLLFEVLSDKVMHSRNLYHITSPTNFFCLFFRGWSQVGFIITNDVPKARIYCIRVLHVPLFL